MLCFQELRRHLPLFAGFSAGMRLLLASTPLCAAWVYVDVHEAGCMLCQALMPRPAWCNCHVQAACSDASRLARLTGWLFHLRSLVLIGSQVGV